ncbi:MAG: DNA gyrase inhibitor YacG [Alphaproteobacteria bacterium]|nr:DNA gyrase inhibitor YacG [Alphaproteobacteria bacterium]
MTNTPILNKKCPICGKQTILEYQPFCSKKCADIDLGRWLKGDYVMHTNEAPTKEEWVKEAFEFKKNE